MRVKVVDPAGLGPAVSVLGLDQALVLRLGQQLREQEGLLVVESVLHVVPPVPVVVARDDDVGPVAAAHVDSCAGATMDKAAVVLK